MLKTKELKKKRIDLYQEVRDIRKHLKYLVTEAKCADDISREKLLDKIDTHNKKITGLLSELDKISEEIESRRGKGKPSNKKVGKVHHVSGKYIDPIGFSGVVQGGAPGSGKRR